MRPFFLWTRTEGSPERSVSQAGSGMIPSRADSSPGIPERRSSGRSADAEEPELHARRIARHASQDIEAALGYLDEVEMIHRDNLVLR